MTPMPFFSRFRVAAALAAGLGFGAWAVQANGAQGALELASAHATFRTDGAVAGRQVASEASARELRFRMRSPRVRELQVRLRQAKYLAVDNVDDRFGALTRDGVQKLQRDSGLPVTGSVDAATWSALLERSRAPTEAELNNRDIGPWFTSPQQQGYVRELQHRLRQVGVYRGPLDGIFDDVTRHAIEAWRARVGLAPSDVMDERAWVPLVQRTRNPRYADLFDAPPASALTQELDARCAEGKVICISRQQRVMSYVVDAK